MLRPLALTGLVLAVVASTAQAQRSAVVKLPTRLAAARLGLERQWFTTVPMEAGHEEVLFFNVDGGVLFVQTSAGNLHAYDDESGRHLWTANLRAATATAYPVSVNSNQAFVTCLNELYALDLRTGREMWEVELEELPSTGTGADENLAMVGLRSGKLVAYLAREKDRGPRQLPRSAGSFAWAWQTNAELSARPIPTPKVIAFGSQDDRVYVAARSKVDERPELLFRFLTGGPISANMAYYGNRTLVVPSADNNVYGVDLFTGKNRWTIATGAPVDQEPLVAGQDAYIINSRGRVIGIDAKTGEQRWDSQSGAERLLALSPTRIYLETLDHDLMIMDRSSGKILAGPRDTRERAGLDIRDLPMSFPNYQDDRLYFASPSGLLVCLREVNLTRPVPLRDHSLAPFGTIPREGLMTDEDVPVDPRAVEDDAGEEAPASLPGDDDGF